MIAWKTIISGFIAPIFAISSPNESFLGADDRSGPLFPISQGTLPWPPILWENGKLPSFVTLEFRNGMGYHYLSVRINSVNDTSISCENFVNFGPVNLELTELICERLYVQHGKTTGVFNRVSQVVLDRFSQSVHHMKAHEMQMIDLYLIFRYVKRRYHCNQIIVGETRK